MIGWFSYSVIRNFAFNFINCTALMNNPIKAYGYLRRGQRPEIGLFKMVICNFKLGKKIGKQLRSSCR